MLKKQKTIKTKMIKNKTKINVKYKNFMLDYFLSDLNFVPLLTKYKSSVGDDLPKNLFYGGH